jgi:hypothetical protein
VNVPPLDDRDAIALAQDVLARRAGYTPEWLPPARGSGAALAQIAARYWEAVLRRLNQAPQNSKLAFLDALGMRLIPAQAARAPMVFRLSDAAADVRLPAGARVAAPPPPETTSQVIFETERSVGLSAGKLAQVFSVWPGRDQYTDHSASASAGTPFVLFDLRAMTNVPHMLYIAHDTLLALKGASTLDVIFELTTPSSEYLDMTWEYWDGQVWREFARMRPECSDEEAAKLDGTRGLRRSGRYRLQADCADAQQTTVNGIRAFWIRGRLDQPLPPLPSRVLPEVDAIHIESVVRRPLASTGPAQAAGYVQRSVFALGPLSAARRKGFAPDQAFVDAQDVDLTKPFYPFGQQPQPGAAFYFTSAEAFGKPGASLDVSIRTTTTPQDGTTLAGDHPVQHEVAWEYWDGREWKVLLDYQTDNASAVLASGGASPYAPDGRDFTGEDVVSLTVPDDMVKTSVNGQEALWMRVRLLSGGYGVLRTITLGNAGQQMAFVLPLPPALLEFQLGYEWHYGPFPPEHVLTYNDFQFADHTAEAVWPGQAFRPFEPSHDPAPSLYLGFDRKQPVDRLGIFFDIAEQRGDVVGPPLIWEYWDGFNWQAVVVEDETQQLRLPGMLSLIGPDDSAPYARFGTPLYWLRARLKQDGPPGEPHVNAIYPNAVWASQHQTTLDEPMGASTGQPNLTLAFRQIPVLAGEQIEVREVAGARANVEWRLVAMELFGDERALNSIEAALGREGPQTEVQQGALRLVRDRAKRVTEVWVRWQGQEHFLRSGPADRHYVVDRARGRVLFGDGVHGRMPPAGAAILARRYVAAGGRAGNLPARTITQVLGPIGGVEDAFNARAAEGGADGETLTRFASRVPSSIQHLGRAVLPADYEALAYEANASVALARAVPCTDSNGHPAPGWVTLVIIPHSAEEQPYPSFGLRREVQQYIAVRAPADGADRITVTGPVYTAVDVAVTVVPLDPAQAGAVDQLVRQSLLDFLHPLHGGPEGEGWAPGRSVFASDVSALLERLDGVDVVQELALSVNGVLQGARVYIPPQRSVVAGRIRVKLLEGEQTGARRVEAVP